MDPFKYQWIADVVKQISYKDTWRILLGSKSASGAMITAYIQVVLPGGQWRGRKWLISEHMTEGEIVQTCLMAFLAAEEHEAREAFTYKGKTIFGPHLSIDNLIAIADQTEVRA